MQTLKRDNRAHSTQCLSGTTHEHLYVCRNEQVQGYANAFQLHLIGSIYFHLVVSVKCDYTVGVESCLNTENTKSGALAERPRRRETHTNLRKVADEVAALAVVLGQDVEKEGLHIIVEGLMVQE